MRCVRTKSILQARSRTEVSQAPVLERSLEAGQAAFGADLSILEDIKRPQVALAYWSRRFDTGLAEWLDALEPQALPHKRFVVARSRIREALDRACASLPDAPEKTALIEDIAVLAERFSDIMSASNLRIRLEAIEGDACRRFHQDAVDARLLCTYRGPGTEWGYADPGEEPTEIRALRRGEAAMCKGSAWRGAAEHRMVHRSPPIAGTGVARLLLVIDPADPEEDDEWAAHGRSRHDL